MSTTPAKLSHDIKIAGQDKVSKPTAARKPDRDPFLFAAKVAKK